MAAPTKSQILATQAKMRAQAKLKNGGKSDAQMATEAKMRAQAAAKKPPVVAGTAKTPPKPFNPNLPPGAPGGPPKTPGQLAFEAKEREQAKSGTGRFSPTAPYNPRAKESIEAGDLPALNEIARAITAQTAQSERSVGQTQQRGAREKANLEELYARLNNFHGGVQNLQKENYNTLRGQAGTAYEQLEKTLTNTYDTAQQRGADEANRLGLGGLTGAVEAFAKSQGDQDFNTGQAQIDKTNLQAGFDQQSQGFDQLMNLTRANTGAESAMRQAVSERETNASVDELQFALQQALAELNGQSVDIKATQGARINDLAAALEDQAYGRTQEKAQQDFNNNLATQQLDLSKSSQAFSQDIARKQQALAELQASIGPEGPSYLEQLQVAKLENEIKADMAASQVGIGQAYDARTGRQPAYIGQPNGVVNQGGRTR